MLSLSKIEAGQIALNNSSFDLHNLLHDIEDMFALRAEGKGLELVFQRDGTVPQHIQTDEVKLRQVMINLLNNAVKFTEHGRVTINVAAEHEPSLRLMFEIEDTGPGIAPDEIESIFEAFGQSETGKRSKDGTGLGLSISRRFVQLMGGDLDVKSQLGKGATFSFDIEARESDASRLPAQVSARRVTALDPGQLYHRILIVDDIWTNRQLMIKLLSPFSFELREAVNGKEAIEIWETWQPHLIWMDMRMPVTDGYEATRRIKNRIRDTQSAYQTVIIALTASSFEEERAVVLNAGCDDYLRKPFKEDHFFDLISKHLGVALVYEEGPEKADYEQMDDDSQISSSLSRLPADILETLTQKAKRADYVELSNLIEEIRIHDTTLAEVLAGLADDFEYDRILALIQEKSP